MITATSGASFRKEPSLSSASAITHSPEPAAALAAAPPGPAAGSSPPRKKVGSAPVSRSAWIAIAVVVVLPWVPATARSLPRSASSASSSPRWRTRCPRSRARASSGLSSPIAVETMTSASSGTRAASWPIAGSIPSARRRSMYEDSARSDPVTSAPRSRQTSASPLIPAPPIAMKWRRRPERPVLTAPKLRRELRPAPGRRSAQPRRGRRAGPMPRSSSAAAPRCRGSRRPRRGGGRA